MRPASYKRKGDKTRYAFVDTQCIGRTCWAPGMFQHRAPLAGGGSMNTSSPDTPCCMTRAYRGCPHGPYGARTVDCGPNHIDQDCPYCGGHGQVHIVGIPEPDKALAKERKEQGWRLA